MMMSLGMFAFSLDTAAYQDLQRKTSYRWATSQRVGARAAGQFLGEGDDNITLSGVILPGVRGDPQSIDTLREMARQGEAWPLVDGGGVVHGAYVITDIDEGQGFFMEDGKARRYDFSVQLLRMDDPEVDALVAGGVSNGTTIV